MAQTSSNTRLILSATKRRGFDTAFELLAVSCGILSVLSERAANSLADRGAALLARYGLRYSVREE